MRFLYDTYWVFFFVQLRMRLQQLVSPLRLASNLTHTTFVNPPPTRNSQINSMCEADKGAKRRLHLRLVQAYYGTKRGLETRLRIESLVHFFFLFFLFFY
jgi:hypothetical protein